MAYLNMLIGSVPRQGKTAAVRLRACTYALDPIVELWIHELKGSGDLEVDGERRRIRPGDAALIPPGAWHTLENDGTSELRFLCCCVPPYSHDDTFFE